MNKTACAVLAATGIVAGCSAMQPSPSRVTDARASSHYCQRDRLNANGDRLECNWQPTANDACRFANSSVLDRSAIAGDPQPGGRCSSGQWLVKATPR